MVDEAAATVSLSTNLVANPSDQPFRVEPSMAVIAGNGSASFSVAITSPDAMLHCGYLVGTQRVIAPESRVALHCSVTERSSSVDEVEDGVSRDEAASRRVVGQEVTSTAGEVSTTAVEVSTTAVEVAPSFGRGPPFDKAADPHRTEEEQLPLVACQISGGFHPYASPPSVPLQPLIVNLNASTIQPCLEPEFPDATDCLSCTCHATDDPATHPSYRQTVVLTNMHSCPLQFVVSMAGAGAATGAGQFQILRAACSSAMKRGTLQTKPLLARLESSHLGAAVGTTQEACMLRPHEHVTVTVQYKPQVHGREQTAVRADASTAARAPTSSSDGPVQDESPDEMIQDQSAADQLLLTYSNGHQQTVPVVAHYLHPVLQVSVVSVDFGAVHIQSPKTLEVELSNPSLLQANWSTQIAMMGSEVGAGASVSFAQGRLLASAPFQTAPSAGKTAGSDKAVQQKSNAVNFSPVPSMGVLPGRGLAMPQKQKLLVTFAPKQTGLCTAEMTVMVHQGRSVRVALSGQGTYSEADEVAATLKDI